MLTMIRRLPSMTGLLAFEAAARHLSFTQAANELALTQSAVSRQISMLEQHIKLDLFVRRGRQLVLTDAGQTLYERVLAWIGQLEGDLLEVQALAAGGGVLELAVVPTFATKWLIPRLPAFYEQHPDMLINLSTQIRHFDFSDTQVDAAIYAGSSFWPGAQCDFLLEDRSIVVCSAALAARNGGLRQPADLARYKLLHQSTRPTAWRDWLVQAGVADSVPERGPRIELFSMLVQAVNAGVGVALVPEVLVSDEVAGGDLIAPFDLTSIGTQGYFLACPHEKLAYGPLQIFRRWLLAAAAAD